MPTSRRSLLSTTVAALASVPLDAVATSAPGPDPVYALIEAHRKAYEVWDAAIDELAKVEGGPDRLAEREAKEAEASACHAEAELTHKIATTPATSLAGALAVLEYVTGTEHDFFADDDDLYELIDSLRCTIAAHLEREG